MAANTKISWATHTMNFWVGCEKVSPACDSCYAEAWAARAGNPELWKGQRRRTKTWRDPYKWNKAATDDQAPGKAAPSVFANSLADFFDNHPDVAPWRADAWKVIADCQMLDWYLVTKRIPNVEKMLPPNWDQDHYRHVVIIITVVTQAEVDRDVPRLLRLKRDFPWLRVGLSIEPMLGPIDLTCVPMSAPDEIGVFRTMNALTGALGHMGRCGPTQTGMLGFPIDWVILGGESGGKARPMNPAWALALRDQCAAAGVPFHFKQWGEWGSGTLGIPGLVTTNSWIGGKQYRADRLHDFPDGWNVVRVGSEKAGRLLDGQVHDAGPAKE